MASFEASLEQVVCSSLKELGLADSATVRDVKDRDFDVEIKIGQLFYRLPSKKEITSDLGVVRQVDSPRHLATLVVDNANDDLSPIVAHTIIDDAGIVHFTTKDLLQTQRTKGFLLCGVCGRFFKGTSGLTGHMQRVHDIEYKDGMVGAKSQLSTYVFDTVTIKNNENDVASDSTNIFKLAQTATVDDFAIAIAHQPQEDFDIRTSLDKNGSTALMWACGGGNFLLVKYLIEEHNCAVNIRQAGRRSFKGRTALHWAARNGHANVVEYLLSKDAEIDAMTADGTTAFCWATWGGYIDVMKVLQSGGCDVTATNTFGCNALLWFSQSPNSTTIECLAYLVDELKFDLRTKNANGHTLIHKCAQRGNLELIEHVTTCYMERLSSENFGGDSENMRPSDLAKADGRDVKLSRLLEKVEKEK